MIVYGLQVCPANSNLTPKQIIRSDMVVGTEYTSNSGNLNYSAFMGSLRWGTFRLYVPFNDGTKLLSLSSISVIEGEGYVVEYHALVKLYPGTNKIKLLKAYQENRFSDGVISRFSLDELYIALFGLNVFGI